MRRSGVAATWQHQIELRIPGTLQPAQDKQPQIWRAAKHNMNPDPVTIQNVIFLNSILPFYLPPSLTINPLPQASPPSASSSPFQPMSSIPAHFPRSRVMSRYVYHDPSRHEAVCQNPNLRMPESLHDVLRVQGYCITLPSRKQQKRKKDMTKHIVRTENSRHVGNNTTFVSSVPPKKERMVKW